MNTTPTPSSTVPPSAADAPRVARGWTVAAYLLPLVLLGLCAAIYAVSPDFYLTYILEAEHRETQAVEITTFLFGFAASLLMLWSLPKLWRQEWHAGSIPGLPGGPIIIAVITLATIFYTGEEISWGQSYLRWKTPEAFLRMDNTETNLHNADTWISVQSLGSLFLVVMFIGLPLAWRLRRFVPLPSDWRSAIASGPVVFTFLCAFAWARLKSMYLAATTEVERAQSAFYIDFVEQMKEHKELLFATGLLLYALGLVQRVRQQRAASSIPAD